MIRVKKWEHFENCWFSIADPKIGEQIAHPKNGQQIARPKRIYGQKDDTKVESYLQAVALSIAVPEQFFLPGRLQLLESLFGLLGGIFQSVGPQSDFELW